LRCGSHRKIFAGIAATNLAGSDAEQGGDEAGVAIQWLAKR
jgi:hypothetical protein